MNASVNRKRLSKLKICLFCLIVISLMTRPSYAGTRSVEIDPDTEETLSGQEDAVRSRFHGHLGGEINYAKGIRNGAHYRGRLIPLYRVEYDEWVYVSNIGGLEVGAWLWQTQDHAQKLGVSVQRHFDQTDFDARRRRQASTDGVINIQWKTPQLYHIHMDYHHDIGNVSRGDSAMLALSRTIIFRQAVFNHDCMLVPRIDIEWESARLVDYYYGVHPEEATSNRPAYSGRETINGGIKMTGFVRINRSWAAFIGMHAAFFGSGITDSPVVTRSVATRGYIGSAWFF